MNGTSGGGGGGTGQGAGTSSSVRASYGAVYVNPVNGHLGPSPRQMPSASNSLQGALSITKTSSTGAGGGPPIDHHQRTIHSDLTTTTSLQPSPPVHLVADGPGPAKMVANPFDLDKEMQRQLEDYNRSIILAHTSPLRIQHINNTFPYFQLAQVQAVVQDLALGQSYVDTYDPTTCTWEQHTVGNVRLVSKQQRLLYRVRKSLLEGLDESECPGLNEEIIKQTQSGGGVKLELPLESHQVQQQQQHSLKRPFQDTSSSPRGPPTKVRITEASMGGGGFVSDPTSSLSPTSTLTHTPMSLQQSLPPPAMAQISSPPKAPSTLSLAPSPSIPPQQRYYPAPPIPVAPALSHHSSTQSNASTRAPQVQIQQTPHTSAPPQAPNAPTASPVIPTTASAPPPPPPPANTVTLSEVQAPPPSSSSSPPLAYTPLLSSQPPAPIPHHPHPPLKRWPNDYTVAEISRGFDSMDALVRNGLPASPGGQNTNSGQGQGITQKVAFERVFGSRYVKSTVCRHRGLWRKADQKLKEQFEKMGGDERAVWGEFVKRVEGRGGSGAAGSTGATGGSNGGSTSSSGRPGSGKHDNTMFDAPPTPVMLGAAPQQQVRSTSGRDDKTKKKAMDNEPVMASL